VSIRVERIADADDPRLADYRLPNATERARHETFVVEGRLLVQKLIASRFAIRSVVTTHNALAEIERALAARGAAACVYLADADVIARVLGFAFHRGCLAAAERPHSPALDELLAPRARVLLGLEGVSNPDNVGGVFRNAAAFGADGVILSPGCGDPLYRKAARVAMGGSLAVPFVHVPDWPVTLARLKAAGFTLVALVPDAGAVELGALRVPARVALLFGAEGEGLGAATRTAADVLATIGMAPGADSLNVATASGIALHRVCAR
jgi:tRNA G18 (ribose-2'-O)-methylase SpoU